MIANKVVFYHMTSYICRLTLEKLCSRNIIKEEDKEVYLFGLELLMATFLKALGLLVVGIVTGLLKEICIFILFFSSLRIQAGGFHAKTVLGCFAGTLVIILGSIALLNQLVIAYQPYYILASMVISIVLVFLFAPLESENKPLNKEEKVIYRRRSLQTVIMGNIIILTLMLVSEENTYLWTIASTGFLFESLSLIPIFKQEN